MAKKSGPLRHTRRHNAIGNVPPSAIYDSFMQRKVQKGGSVTLSAGLQQGVRVTVAQVSETVFVVGSSREELTALLERLPKRGESPFAMLAETLRGRPHEVTGERTRPQYSGLPIVPERSDDEVMRGADLRRTTRIR